MWIYKNIKLKSTYLSPIDVTSEIIKNINKLTLNKIACNSLSADGVDVVIGIPSSFKKEQRDAIMEV